MKRTIWIVLAAILVVGLIFGSAAARKYKQRGHGALLGVETQSVDKKLAEAFKLSIDYGAVINDVLNHMPADRAGLKEDDVIIQFDGKKVMDSDDLSDFLEDYDGGAVVTVVVQRDDSQKEFSVELASKDDFKGMLSLRGLADLAELRYLPNTPDAPRMPRVPSAPQAYWYDSHRPYMGVSLMDLTRQLGDYFGVERGRGVLVTEVERDSPAEVAGLKAGDIIVRLNDDAVRDYEDVQDLISEADPGDQVKVAVVRDKKEVVVEVKVEERSDGRDLDGRLGGYSVPDFGNLQGNGVWNGSYDWSNGFEYYWDSEDREEFNEDMRELREEMRGLQDELNEELRGITRSVQ